MEYIRKLSKNNFKKYKIKTEDDKTSIVIGCKYGNSSFDTELYNGDIVFISKNVDVVHTKDGIFLLDETLYQNIVEVEEN